MRLAQEPRRYKKPDDADRDVHIEDESPAEILDEPTSEDGADSGRDQHRDPEYSHHPPHVLGTDGLQDDGHANWHQHASADALHDAEEDQLAEVLRDPTEHRGHGERHDGDQVEPLGSPAVRRPAG